MTNFPDINQSEWGYTSDLVFYSLSLSLPRILFGAVEWGRATLVLVLVLFCWSVFPGRLIHLSLSTCRALVFTPSHALHVKPALPPQWARVTITKSIRPSSCRHQPGRRWMIYGDHLHSSISFFLSFFSISKFHLCVSCLKGEERVLGLKKFVHIGRISGMFIRRATCYIVEFG